jgi:hypothetical protein
VVARAALFASGHRRVVPVERVGTVRQQVAFRLQPKTRSLDFVRERTRTGVYTPRVVPLEPRKDRLRAQARV